MVAPRAGAWIETRAIRRTLPLLLVARAGAWIETLGANHGFGLYRVAPRAGAWIETEHREG